MKHFRKNTHIAMSVKRGLFQVQRVDFDSGGVSVVTPLTGWMPIESARLAMAEHADKFRLESQNN